MVQAGASPEALDAMEMTDVIGWYGVMAAYQREVQERRPKVARK